MFRDVDSVAFLLFGCLLVGCNAAYQYRVSGVLTRADGTPASDVAVTGRVDFPARPDELGEIAHTDAAGHFELTAESPFLHGNLFYAPPPWASIVYLYPGGQPSRELQVRVETLPQPWTSGDQRTIALPTPIVLDGGPPAQTLPTTLPSTSHAAY